MTVAEIMRAKLAARLAPLQLDIVDDSHHHVDHAGSHPDGESHFTVTIVATAFAGLNRVARQRLVYDALAEELATRVHALSVRALAPDDVRQSLDASKDHNR